MENHSTVNSAASAVDVGLRQYMMRVYNYMAGGLALTALCAYAVAHTSLLGWFFNINPAAHTASLSAFGWIILLAPFIMILGYGWILSKGTPRQAQILFWAFSAVMGASLAPIFLAYTSSSITRIFLITAAMFGGMSIYGYTTKKDLTGMGSFMTMGLIGVIIAMIVNFFLKSPALYYGLSVLSVIIFTGLTAYDTQKIRAYYDQAGTSEMGEKLAVFGALSLYLDFINLFLALLRLFGNRNN